MAESTTDRRDPQMSYRWFVLVGFVLVMMAIANFQYAWTLFVSPVGKTFHATRAEVQGVFTAFTVIQTFVVPFAGYLVDRFGGRWIVTLAGLIVGGAWILAGNATSLSQFYLYYAAGGIGVGAIYGSSVGTATKWFPDRRGLTAGIVAGSYGFGTLFTVLPISHMIASSGWQHTMFVFGIIQGIVILIAAQIIKSPEPGWKPQGWVPKVTKSVMQSARNSTPLEMVQTMPFYVLYIMMTLVAFGGLMVTAQLAPIGADYGYDKAVVFGTGAVTLALMLDRFLNGFTRPIWGYISDRIGRYNTMALAFGCQAVALFLFIGLIRNPVMFVIMSGATFFFWGEIYSLFPAAITDVYGTKHSTTNYGIQYTSKGVASFLAAPIAALVVARTGSWTGVFYFAAACDAVAAVLAFFWLKPMVARLLSQSQTDSRKIG